MFGLKKGGPDKAFSHSDDCGIVAVDPGVSIPWNETRTGHWEARCQCGVEYFDQPVADRRVRLDPLDPRTANHLPQREFVTVTDPAVLRVLLKVTDKGDYAWVECGSCEAGWQVLFYAERIGARR
jgi:hypothetical protein